ncbi:MAG: hypothetical protein ACTSQO_01525 [Candidatus Helarchaeota archaeon]
MTDSLFNNYEKFDAYNKRNLKSLLIGIILAISGFSILIYDKLNSYYSYYSALIFLSLLLICTSPLFISNLFTELKSRNIGEIGNRIKNFIILEVIFIAISFNLIFIF